MISIKVPPLGESIVEATVARWLKQEGESVAQGDTLVELETDKITVEVPAFKSGVLAKQLKHEGDVVTVDEDLGELQEAATGAPAPQPSVAPAPAERAIAGAPVAAAAQEKATATPPRSSPAVRRIAAEERIDI